MGEWGAEAREARTYVARDVLEDVGLERHVHVDGADDVAEFSLDDFEDAGHEDGVAFDPREGVSLRASQPQSQHAPDTSFHRRLALASTYFRKSCRRAK